MLDQLNFSVPLLFILTSFLTYILFIRCVRNSIWASRTRQIAIIMAIWLVFQAVLSYSLFYLETIKTLPPPFVLVGFLPPFVFILILFNHSKGKAFIDSLPLKDMTWISVVRVPVELVLWFLFLNHYVPELMTFEGRNFDILAGLTAPIMVYLVFVKKLLSRPFLFWWNLISLGLLINIIVNASLSLPSAIQLLAFDQPNLGILHFPFSWLPSFVVPIVLFTHLASIRQLLKIKPVTR